MPPLLFSLVCDLKGQGHGRSVNGTTRRLLDEPITLGLVSGEPSDAGGAATDEARGKAPRTGAKGMGAA
jgi:hypothetical protein